MGLGLNNVQQNVLLLLIMIPVFAIHELAHAVSALWLGDDTAKRQGRITLNPMKHIDPIGLIVFVVAGFGWAKPVMVNPIRLRWGKLGFAITAFAGPLANIVLGAVLAVVTGFIYRFAGSGNIVGNFFLQATGITLFLAAFNLMPFPPFDGSKILALFVPNRYYDTIVSGGMWSLILMMVLVFTGIHRYITIPMTDFFLDNMALPIIDIIAPNWLALGA